MNNDKENLLKEHIEKLHPAVLQAIKESKWGESLHEVGKKFDLHIDEMGALENETLFVMIGVSEPEEFLGNIIESSGLDRAKAVEISKEINLRIFIPIREIIKKKLNRPESEQEAEEELNRNKILSEIENPSPHRETSMLTEEKGRSVPLTIPAKPAEPSTPAVPPPPPPPPSQAIYMEKLAGPVNYDPQKKEVTLPGKPILNLDREPKKYSTDPYRELP